MRRGSWWAASFLAAASVAAGPVAGQSPAPRGFAGLSFVAGNPVGDLGSFFDQSFGGQLELAWAASDDGRVRLRTDLGFMIYGYEEIQLCHPVGCRIQTDLTTTNNIFYGGVGPELVLATGALEPYVYGTLGLSYFATISTLGDGDGSDTWARTTNYSDLVMAWKAGGGARVRLRGGPHPISIDLGVERHQNGIADFLTKGDIVDNADGSITLSPNRSEANLVTFRVGVSVGFGARRAPE